MGSLSKAEHKRLPGRLKFICRIFLPSAGLYPGCSIPLVLLLGAGKMALFWLAIFVTVGVAIQVVSILRGLCTALGVTWLIHACLRYAAIAWDSVGMPGHLHQGWIALGSLTPFGASAIVKAAIDTLSGQEAGPDLAGLGGAGATAVDPHAPFDLPSTPTSPDDHRSKGPERMMIEGCFSIMERLVMDRYFRHTVATLVAAALGIRLNRALTTPPHQLP